jgi:O-antigen/teichoic acid export membrane protein
MTIVRNTAYNLSSAGVSILVSILTVPLYLKLIGLDRFGVLSLCWVLVGYFGIFEFGLGTATSQRIAKMKGDPPEFRSEALWTAIGLSLILGVAGCLLLWGIAAPILESVRGLSHSMTSEIQSAIVWLGVLVPLTTVYAVLSGALQGREEFVVMNTITGSGNVLTGIVPLAVAAAFGPQLGWLIGSLVVARAIIVGALLSACYLTLPLSGPRKPTAAMIKSLASFGGWVAISAAIVPVLTSAEKLAIGWAVGAAAVSVYMIPFSLVARVLVLPQSFSSALFPKFAVLDPHLVDAVERRALSTFSALITPLIIVAMTLIAPFLRIWVGHRIASQCAQLGPILLLGAWFNCCTYVPYSRLQGSGHPELVTRILVAQVVPYAVLLLLLLRWGGVTGAALAWSARMLAEMILLFLLTRQPRELLRIVYGPACIVMLASVTAFLFPFPNVWGTPILGGFVIASGVIAVRRGHDVLTKFNPLQRRTLKGSRRRT